MPLKTVMAYIEKQRKSGYSDAQIRKVLLEHHWKHQLVDEGFKKLGSAGKAKGDSPFDGAHEPKKRSPVLWFILTLITAGLLGIVWTLLVMKEMRSRNPLAPSPWWILIVLIPLLGSIIFSFKFAKGLHEVTDFSAVGMFFLMLLLTPVGLIVAQFELNHHS